MEGEVRPVGKLALNEAFRGRMQALMGMKGSNSGESPVERPFYVSSPFFSRMNEMED